MLKMQARKYLDGKTVGEKRQQNHGKPEVLTGYIMSFGDVILHLVWTRLHMKVHDNLGSTNLKYKIYSLKKRLLSCIMGVIGLTFFKLGSY